MPAIHSGENEFIILDTGSPISFSETAKIDLLQTRFQVLTSISGMVDVSYLKKYFKKNITGLIGMDIMKKYSLKFDYKLKQVDFKDPNCPVDGRHYNKLEVIISPTNIPMIEILLPQKGVSVRAIIDTGSKHTYISSDLLEELTLSGNEYDFNPVLGDFVTNKYSGFIYQVGQTCYTHSVCEFAPLTKILKTVKSSILLGHDFLYDNAWVLDYTAQNFSIEKRQSNLDN